MAAVALVFAALNGAAAGWIAQHCWGPVITEAIAAMPAEGAIEKGELRWPQKEEGEGRLLAANQFLAIETSYQDNPDGGSSADLGVELMRAGVRFQSLLGTATVGYPKDFGLNRTQLGPAWGAWRAPLVAGLAGVFALGLMASWFVLAAGYALWPLAVGAVFGKDLPFRASWKLAVAAQWAGSVVMVFALGLYGLGEISLIFLVSAWAAHFVPTGVYLLISPFLVRKVPVEGEANPFEDQPAKKLAGKNPFRG